MNLYRLHPNVLLLGEHSYLDTTDECYFTNIYQCRHRRGIKSQILALKRGEEACVSLFAAQVGQLLPRVWASGYTFVPMPPSHPSSGIEAIVRQLPVLDRRDLLVQTTATPSSHGGWRITPRQRQAIMAINELVADPRPRGVVVVDDVLTTGAHFRAAKYILQNRWEHMRVIGLFLARVCLRVTTDCPASPEGAWPCCCKDSLESGTNNGESSSFPRQNRRRGQRSGAGICED